jgi:hypothetical protein
MTRVAAGPVVAYPDDGEPSYGDELRLRTGAGTSDGDDLAVAETGMRLLVTERSQSLGAELGPAYVLWLGPSAFTASFTPGLGVEHFDDKVFFNASLHGALGTGIVLDERVRRDHSWNWLVQMEGVPEGPPHVIRKRIVLTLDIAGGLDARTTRDPLFTVGVLVGIAWVNERYTVPAADPVEPWRAPAW